MWRKIHETRHRACPPQSTCGFPSARTTVSGRPARRFRAFRALTHSGVVYSFARRAARGKPKKASPTPSRGGRGRAAHSSGGLHATGQRRPAMIAVVRRREDIYRQCLVCDVVLRRARSYDGAPKGPWETVRLSKGMVLFPVVSVALPLEAAAPACARYTSHLDDPKDSGRALRIAKGRI